MYLIPSLGRLARFLLFAGSIRHGRAKTLRCLGLYVGLKLVRLNPSQAATWLGRARFQCLPGVPGLKGLGKSSDSNFLATCLDTGGDISGWHSTIPKQLFKCRVLLIGEAASAEQEPWQPGIGS